MVDEQSLDLGIESRLDLEIGCGIGLGNFRIGIIQTDRRLDAGELLQKPGSAVIRRDLVQQFDIGGFAAADLSGVETDAPEIRLDSLEQDSRAGRIGQGDDQRSHWPFRLFPATDMVSGKGDPVLHRHAGPVRIGVDPLDIERFWNDLEPALPGADAGKRCQQRRAIDRHGENFTVCRHGPETLGAHEPQAKEAGNRIQPQVAAADIRRADQRQMMIFAIEHDLGAAGPIASDGDRGGFAAQRYPAVVLLFRFLLILRQLFELAELDAIFLVEQPHRTRTVPRPEQAHFRLGQQLQEIGMRRVQLDLDHPAGHRDDFVHGRHIIAQAAVAQFREALVQQPRHAFGGDLATVVPLRIEQPENIAEAVVGDNPAGGEGRDHAAFLVEPDQTLGDRCAHGRGSEIQAVADRIDPGIPVLDHGNAHLVLVAGIAAGAKGGECKGRRDAVQPESGTENHQGLIRRVRLGCTLEILSSQPAMRLATRLRVT